MKECNIILKVDGVELPPFKSDEDLDGWLFDHQDSLEMSGKDLTFSLSTKSPMEVTKDQIRSAMLRHRNIVEQTIKIDGKVPVRVSPTTFTRYGGADQNINGTVLWVKPLFKGNISKNKTEDDFGKKVRMPLGNDFDEMMQVSLGTKSAPNLKLLKDPRTEGYKQLWQTAQLAVKEIKRRHPNAEFWTQKEIAAKQLSSNFVKSLQLALSNEDVSEDEIKGGKARDINSFTGIPDLIVIEPDGSAYVYDFKTSESDVTVDSHREYAAQIAVYSQMLRQWGINVKGAALIPVKVNYMSNNPDAGEANLVKSNAFELQKFSELLAGDDMWNTVEKWLPTEKKTNYGELKELNEVLKVVAPNTSVTKQAEFKTLQVELEVKDIFPTKQNNPEYSNGNIYCYQCNGARQGDDRFLYGKTKEELTGKIEKWVETYNSRAAETYSNFAEDLRSAMVKGTVSALAEIAKTYNSKDQKYIVTAFRRYLNGWSLISDAGMVSQGLFLFQKGDLIEMVVLDTYNPYSKINWEHANSVRKWTTILGHFKADDEYVDKRWVLTNFQCNLCFMKGFIFLAQHPDLFSKGVSLNKIATMSLNKNAYVEESLEKLNENYRLIALEYQKQTGITLNHLTIGKEIKSDVEAFVGIAEDILRDSEDLDIQQMLNDKHNPFSGIKTNADYTIDELRKMIDKLRFNISSSYTDDNTKKQALEYLYRAWLAKLGYSISPEERVGSYTGNGLNFNGLYATSFADSPSAIARTLHEAVYSFTRVCQTEFVKFTADWKQKIKQLYRENGVDENIGGAWNFFSRFFVTENGKISSKFMLKGRGEMNTTTENEVLDMFYDALDRFQYGKGFTDDKTFLDKKEDAIRNGTYGEVPLINSKLTEKREKLGSIKAIVEKAKVDWNIMKDFLLGVDISDSHMRELDNIDVYRIPALVFEVDDREEKLNKSEDAVNKYTTDLDLIFNMIVAQGIKHWRSPEILITTSAIRGVLANYVHFGANESNGVDLVKTEQGIKDYIKVKLFNRPIMDKGELRLARVVNFVKGVTGFITLGANLRALARETITGIERGWLRFAFKPEYEGVINKKDYMDALNELIANCYKNGDVMTFHMQLNALYGTANFSYDQMADSQKIMQNTLKDTDLNDLYFTSTWPDFIHRNAMVIAYLKGIGAYEAHYLKDGKIYYDMKKDKRFNLFNKYRRKEDVPASEIRRWNLQRELYEDELNSWINNNYRKPDGTRLQYGDDLPYGLSPRTVLGLKDMADRLYGNYDSETKSLMMKQLLGSIFFQFRTYGLMRVRELFDGGGSTSDIRMVADKMKNKDGKVEDAWITRETDTAAIERGEKTSMKLIPDSEITADMIKDGAVRARHASSYYSTPGQVQTLIDLGASLFWHKNQEEFNNLWKNCPDYRVNVGLFMIDTFGMLLLSLLIQSIYGDLMTGDYNEIDWFTKWSYNVAIGVTQDGPVWQVVSSVFGDGTPPMLGIIQSFSNNAWSTITGKKNFLEGVANTFGATRELAYLFHTAR